VEASEPQVSPNAELLAAIKKLPQLRRVCLVSYHRTYDGSFPEAVIAFVTGLQKEADAALTHLNTISLWAAGSEPWSCTWRKRYVDSTDGKTRLDWLGSTNEIVNPDRSLSEFLS